MSLAKIDSGEALPFAFLSLPKEVRLMVYERIPRLITHHRTNDSHLPSRSILDKKSARGLTFVTPSTTTAILCVNKEINREARNVLKRSIHNFILDKPPRILAYDELDSIDLLGKITKVIATNYEELQHRLFFQNNGQRNDVQPIFSTTEEESKRVYTLIVGESEWKEPSLNPAIPNPNPNPIPQTPSDETSPAWEEYLIIHSFVLRSSRQLLYRTHFSPSRPVLYTQPPIIEMVMYTRMGASLYLHPPDDIDNATRLDYDAQFRQHMRTLIVRCTDEDQPWRGKSVDDVRRVIVGVKSRRIMNRDKGSGLMAPTEPDVARFLNFVPEGILDTLARVPLLEGLTEEIWEEGWLANR